MIELINLVKIFGTYRAVDSLNLTIPKGEMFGFLGPNGAGKTTTIKLMTGLLKPSEGRVEIDGVAVESAPQTAKAMIGYIPDRPFIYEKLTGREYLRFIADLYGVPDEAAQSRAERFLEFFDLADAASQLVGSYSHGMRQKLIISGALIHTPKAVIVDEPLVGLDPKGARQVKRLFRELCNAGTTIFMSTHSLPIAETMCDRIGIIQKGQMIAVGTMDELRERATHEGEGLEEIFLKLTGDHGLDDLFKELNLLDD
ncbi:MAG: ABC transporter ATP-binding protein [Candidatus Nitrohelix vancouverensis]|uniref:ABC transporter ATP-binding protein n=1 Tax=Candidatus Nitrohelix vancouverensis TaxID=2705534 RepID=A0A7T0C1M5_9BACT|nr:MAG: ABC transporter ATP-binding protein [Candidatus Nitrohelix vancouverensis]